MALRLGTKVIQPHTCRCGVSVSRDGHHGLSCRQTKGRQPRHKDANDVIYRSMGTAGLLPVLEPSGVFAQVDGKRPDGKTQVPDSNGKCLLWDFTSPDTLAASHLSNTSRKAGSAA